MLDSKHNEPLKYIAYVYRENSIKFLFRRKKELMEVIVFGGFALPKWPWIEKFKAHSFKLRGSLNKQHSIKIEAKKKFATMKFLEVFPLFPSFLETLEEMDSELLKCEFCGKMGYANEFLRSKRFCTMSCAKRYFCYFEFPKAQTNNHCNKTKKLSECTSSQN